MDQVLQPWLGKPVILTLRTAGLNKIRGVLVEGGASFLVLEQEGKGRFLIPVSSILHVWSGDDEALEEISGRDLTSHHDAIFERTKRSG
jgi:hypothetical protein